MVDGGGEKKGIVGMVGNEGIVVGMEESSGGSATSAYVVVCQVATVKNRDNFEGRKNNLVNNRRLYQGRKTYYSLNQFLEFKD